MDVTTVAGHFHHQLDKNHSLKNTIKRIIIKCYWIKYRPCPIYGRKIRIIQCETIKFVGFAGRWSTYEKDSMQTWKKTNHVNEQVCIVINFPVLISFVGKERNLSIKSFGTLIRLVLFIRETKTREKFTGVETKNSFSSQTYVLRKLWFTMNIL